MQKYVGNLAKYPARTALAWYLGVIAVGTLLLWLPVSRQDRREPVSLVDAAFTATSATCVTGLTVRSTANDFSFFGQVVILLLIQLGGIGILTITTFVFLSLGGSDSLRRRMLVAQTVGNAERISLRRLLTLVVVTVFGIESLGFFLLLVRNWIGMTPAIPVWEALFHSVSAFCNAGFALRDDSLIAYRSDPLVNATMIGLIVFGGLGFPVLLDIVRTVRGKRARLWERCHLHTKLMLIGTVLLLLLGSASFLALEWNGSLRDEPAGTKLLAACFHSATTRTAGFFTTGTESLGTPTLFVAMLLMLVGAGPCSTGGGLKVSSLMVLVLCGWWRFRGVASGSVFRRSVSRRSVERAVTTALLFAAVAVVGLAVLLIVQHSSHASTSDLDFLDASFEVASALGTVGLSTGLTPRLSDLGKVVVMILMLTGRLGPVSVLIALSRVEEPSRLEFPEEEVLVG